MRLFGALRCLCRRGLGSSDSGFSFQPLSPRSMNDLTPIEVKEGDRVLMTKYGGTEVELDGKEYKLLRSDDILALVE